VDASPAAASYAGVADSCERCGWCRQPIGITRPHQLYCSRKCRQTAWRMRRAYDGLGVAGSPLRFAYADPPFPGKSFLYRGHPDYRGEFDHRELIASLEASYQGWALSTGAYALRELLPLCPPRARVLAWVKPIGVSSKTYGLHNSWEPLIVCCGRRLQPGFRDWLACQPARHGGELIGRKPIQFCGFLFRALGMLPGDSLDDLFPGTGIVGLAWRNLCDAALVP